MAQKLKVIESPTLRGIVNMINELSIDKDTIVHITKENGIHILLYYGED